MDASGAPTDFDGDGSPTFCGEATRANLHEWRFDSPRWLPGSAAGPDWTVVGLGDFDGDGEAHILPRNGVTGENYLYPEGYLRMVADAN